MKLSLATIAVIALVETAAAEPLRKGDVAKFDLWTKAVREEFTLYRSFEDELLYPQKVDNERASLRRNLHQDLEPDQDVTARLVQAGKPFFEVDNCRIAIRRFRSIMATAQRVNSITEKPYPAAAKEYLEAVERCEQGMKFPAFKSRFREVVRATF